MKPPISVSPNQLSTKPDGLQLIGSSILGNPLNFKARAVESPVYSRIGSAFTTSPTVKAPETPKLLLVRDITENFHLRNPCVVIIPFIVKTAVKEKHHNSTPYIFMYLHDIHFIYPTIGTLISTSPSMTEFPPFFNSSKWYFNFKGVIP